MTIKTWKQQIEKHFTPEEISRFNELYELHASSMQFERIAISNDEVNFVDSNAAGPVEDIVLKPKATPSAQDNASPVTHAIFLNVSDYEQIVFELISLAKRHDFDIERMLNEMHGDSEQYDCENILFPSMEGEVSF